MFQNISLPAAQKVRDKISGVTPCIVMKNEWVLYHQVSSFSPEHWTKVVLQERALVGSFALKVQRGAVLPHQRQYVIMNITFTAHSVGCTFFGQGDPGCFRSFD